MVVFAFVSVSQVLHCNADSAVLRASTLLAVFIPAAFTEEDCYVHTPSQATEKAY